MSSEERSTQIKVGIFILMGLVTVGLMVVYFGRVGESFASYYNVRVEFTNASGLLRGSEVLLAGAKVGRITNEPTILPDRRGVYVDVRILTQVQIPVGSHFTIGSSGLLGDKYIEIQLASGEDSTDFLAPGAIIKGTSGGGGFGGMASGAEALISDLRTTVDNINTVVKKLDSTVLSKEELATVTTTISNLEKATGKIAAASDKVDGLILNADEAIEGGKETLGAAKKAAEELQQTLAALRNFIDQARAGKGVMGTLVSNREMADNLRSFILNLRKNGILWYKDTPKGTER